VTFIKSQAQKHFGTFYSYFQMIWVKHSSMESQRILLKMIRPIHMVSFFTSICFNFYLAREDENITHQSKKPREVKSSILDSLMSTKAVHSPILQKVFKSLIMKKTRSVSKRSKKCLDSFSDYTKFILPKKWEILTERVKQISK